MKIIEAIRVSIGQQLGNLKATFLLYSSCIYVVDNIRVTVGQQLGNLKVTFLLHPCCIQVVFLMQTLGHGR
jgi:hypothetical protein